MPPRRFCWLTNHAPLQRRQRLVSICSCPATPMAASSGPGPCSCDLQQPFTAGLHRLNNLWVYISRGTGYWGPPNRFGVPSEITLLRLVPAKPTDVSGALEPVDRVLWGVQKLPVTDWTGRTRRLSQRFEVATQGRSNPHPAKSAAGDFLICHTSCHTEFDD